MQNVLYLLSVTTSLYQDTQYKGALVIRDSKMGNQLLHFDCNGTSQLVQFDVRIIVLVVNAGVTKGNYCNAI